MGFEQQIMQYAQQIQTAAIGRAHDEHSPGRHNVPVQEEYPDGIEQYYADIPSQFTPFSELPDPAAYDSMVDSLRQALGLLRVNADTNDPIDPNDQLAVAQPAFATLAGAGNVMSSWDGAAAVAFKNNFLSPFPVFTQNQFLLIAILKASIEAQQKLWAGARNDITTIAQTTLDALDNVSCTQNAWVITFTMLSSIASIVGVPLEGAAAVTFAIVGAVASMAATATPMVDPGTDRQQFSGENAKQITNAMDSAMMALYEKISAGQEKMNDALIAAIDFVHVNRSAHFEAPRPLVADMSTSQEYSDQGLGVPG